MARTDAYSPHAVAVHPRTPGKVALAVAASLIELERDEHSRERLAALGFAGFESAVDEDWADVRRLHLEDEVRVR